MSFERTVSVDSITSKGRSPDRLKCMMETKPVSFSSIHVGPSPGSRKLRCATYLADAAVALYESYRRAGMRRCLDAQRALKLGYRSSAD